MDQEGALPTLDIPICIGNWRNAKSNTNNLENSLSSHCAVYIFPHDLSF